MEHGGEQIIEAQQECLQGETIDILAPTTKSLIAIGVAAGLNCHACLRRLIPAAVNDGILAEEVTAALAVAREVRARVSGLTDDYTTALIQRETATSGSEFRTVDRS